VVGYTQERLAAVLGVERSTVVRWEAGETCPQPWCRPKLAKTLAISVEELDTMLTNGETADDTADDPSDDVESRCSRPRGATEVPSRQSSC
jgi:DNA-binding XRE family transcriptional regulator